MSRTSMGEIRSKLNSNYVRKLIEPLKIRDLIGKVKSLIYNTEISVKKKGGKPLNVDFFTLKVEKGVRMRKEN